MVTQIFRQAALDRLSSPEQLDRALTVTTPKVWLSLAAMAIAAAAIVVWSVEGEVPTYVKANGILLNHDGIVVDAMPSGGGTLSRIIVAVGDSVKKGKAVAEVTDRELLERYRTAVALAEERKQSLADFKAAGAAEDAVIEENLDRQRARLQQIERGNRQQVNAARERLDNHRQLFRDRIVTRATVDHSQQTFDRVQRELFNTLRERDSLESRELHRRNERKARVAEMGSSLHAAERRVSELLARLDTQRVAAPVSGRVTEIKAAVGAVLHPGQPVLSIETVKGDLGVRIYIPPVDGKKVKPGMEVLVSPTTVRQEEYGFLRGEVENVSKFPASREGMIAVLENRSLVETLTQDGAPYTGRVLLEPDTSTASGFAWTSPKASEEELTSGTLASAEIKVESQAPITLVIPLLKKTFGL